MGTHYTLDSIATAYAFISMGVLLLPIRFIDYFNRILFIALLGVVGLMIVGLLLSLDGSHLPLLSKHYAEPSVWMALIPVVFTSFGFQVIFHTLTNYCHHDAKMLKQAFFWGSLIPAIVYILWTCSILGVVYQDNPLYYQQLVEGKADVGVLIQILSSISQWQSIRLLIWCISFLAIGTSVLGVGVGLLDAIKGMLPAKMPQGNMRNMVSALLTIVPAYLAVIFIPNAFIAILGFAGMILALIAIVLPVYIYLKMDIVNLYYKELENKWLIGLCCVAAFTVIACEIYNMV
jgi:tyrosine-specific transport protein